MHLIITNMNLLYVLFCCNCAGVAAEDVYAVFNGKPLADGELLSLAGVEEEQTLYILGRCGDCYIIINAWQLHLVMPFDAKAGGTGLKPEECLPGSSCVWCLTCQPCRCQALVRLLAAFTVLLSCKLGAVS